MTSDITTGPAQNGNGKMTLSRRISLDNRLRLIQLKMSAGTLRKMCVNLEAIFSENLMHF